MKVICTILTMGQSDFITDYHKKKFCRILLEQIKIGVERRLLKEQTGVRPKRSMIG